MRTLYIKAKAARTLPGLECVIAVSPLLVALIDRTTEMDAGAPPTPAEARVLRVAFDEIRALPELPLYASLPAPEEREVARTCAALLRDPGSKRGLEQWAADAGCSGRTLERRFKAATGMSFRLWRQQVRLLEAVARLGQGVPITRIALDLGYDSSSAFSAMFRRVLGVAPSHFD
jgi:AraC-like DNA-binding protein